MFDNIQLKKTFVQRRHFIFPTVDPIITMLHFKLHKKKIYVYICIYIYVYMWKWPLEQIYFKKIQFLVLRGNR